MKPAEINVDDRSSFFSVYAPTSRGGKAFLLPLRSGIFVYEPGYELHRRSFDSFLFMFVESGSLSVEMGEERSGNGVTSAEASGDGAHRDERSSLKRWTVSEGQFCFIDCYQPHSYCAPQGARVAWCHFDGPTARNMVNYIVDQFGWVCEQPSTDKPREVLHSLIELMKNADGFSEMRMNSVMVELLAACYFSYSPVSWQLSAAQKAGKTNADDTVTASHTAQAIDNAQAYISHHLAEPLDVTEIASAVYLSRAHFIRAFRDYTGVTPYAYITRLRIQTAQYLLVHSSQPIAAIASACGFASPSVFGMNFKRAVGMTPRQYRQAQNGHSDNLAQKHQ